MTAIRNFTIGTSTNLYSFAECQPGFPRGIPCLWRVIFRRRIFMRNLSRTVLGFLISLLFFTTALAQTAAQTQQSNNQPPTPVVTATASSNRVRYVSMGEVNQTRLQIFSPDG